MKAFIYLFVVIALLTSPLVSRASSTPTTNVDAELSARDRDEITKVLQAYVDAFDRGDLSGVKKYVTAEFIELVGGLDHLKKELHAKAVVKKSRPLKDLRIEKRPFGTFAQFTLDAVPGTAAEVMDEDSWFRLTKTSAGWRLQRKESDFSLE